MPLNNKTKTWVALVRLIGATVVISPVLGLPARMAKVAVEHSCSRSDRALSWMLVYFVLGLTVPLTYWLENVIFKRVVRKEVPLWAWFNKCGRDFVDAFEESRDER